MSGSVSLTTEAMPSRKGRSVNATNTSFTGDSAPTTSITEPVTDAGTATGQATIDLVTRPNTGGGRVQNAVKLEFFGTGNDDTTFVARVYGWYKLPGNGTTVFDLWYAVKLLEVTCTLSTVVGQAGAGLGASERFADTLVIVGTSGNDDVSMELVSPADNTIAHAIVDMKGAWKLQLTYDLTGATAANCLVTLL